MTEAFLINTPTNVEKKKSDLGIQDKNTLVLSKW